MTQQGHAGYHGFMAKELSADEIITKLKFEEHPEGGGQCSGQCGSRKHVVPAGHWQAAEPFGEYSLVGCTVAPGFEFEDFSFMPQKSVAVTELLALRPDLNYLL